MRDFKNIDVAGDGNIQFIEFLRAACIKKDICIPLDISIFDKLRIYQVIEYRHITEKEIEELNSELETIKCSVDKNYLAKNLFKNLLWITIISGTTMVLS